MLHCNVFYHYSYIKPTFYQVYRVITQKPRDGGKHIYALHAPEVECIGKGKAHKPYEFGVKVSVATTLNRSKANDG